MADRNNPFGFDAEDFDRFAREAGDGLRDAFGKIFEGSSAGSGGWSVLFDQATRRPRPQPETAGETGSGVWAIFTVDDQGGARVEQVFASELDALRANQHNVETNRRVRFLPYGITVGALDAAIDSPRDSDGVESD